MSFLQWAGGKVKTIGQIAPYIPKRIENYYEPFLGGGSVLIHILQQADMGEISLIGKVVAADINEPLIKCYQAIKDDPEGVIDVFERLCGAYEACPHASTCKKHYCVCCCQECMYHAIRTCFNIYKNAPIVPETEMAGQFLFLNATCYRGLYRESKAGAFNTCYWTSRPIFPKSDRITIAARLFQKYDVQFVTCSYKHFWDTYLYENLHSDDLCYIDPPYVKDKPEKVKEKSERKSKTTNENDNDFEDIGTYGKFLTVDAVWIKEWILKRCAHNDTDPMILYSTYGVPANEIALWPFVHSFSAHRSMMYKGSSCMNECIITNVSRDKVDEKMT